MRYTGSQMEGYLKKQFVAQNRFSAAVTQRTGDALYAGCLPQTASTGAHALTLVREHASQSKGPCWEGYHRDYHKEKYSEGSCVKNGSGDTKKKKKKKEKKGGDASSSSSSEDEDGKPKKKKAKKEEK